VKAKPHPDIPVLMMTDNVKLELGTEQLLDDYLYFYVH
jgi:hypothetical protein